MRKGHWPALGICVGTSVIMTYGCFLPTSLNNLLLKGLLLFLVGYVL